jgi:hypothetical protein
MLRVLRVSQPAYGPQSCRRPHLRSLFHGLGSSWCQVVQYQAAYASTSASTSAQAPSSASAPSILHKRSNATRQKLTEIDFNRTLSIEDLVANRATVQLINSFSDVNAILKTPATANMDKVITLLKQAHNGNIIVPVDFFIRAIDICAQRHDAPRIELLLKLCQENCERFMPLTSLSPAGRQLGVSAQSQLVRSDSENESDPFAHVASHAIARLMRSGSVHSAMQLWQRMDSNPNSFTTTKRTLELVLDNMCQHPFPLNDLEKIREVFVRNSWNHHVSSFYGRILACFEQHMVSYPRSIYAANIVHSRDEDLLETFIFPAMDTYVKWTKEAEVASRASVTTVNRDFDVVELCARKLKSMTVVHGVIQEFITIQLGRVQQNTVDGSGSPFSPSVDKAKTMLSALEADMAACYSFCCEHGSSEMKRKAMDEYFKTVNAVYSSILGDRFTPRLPSAASATVDMDISDSSAVDTSASGVVELMGSYAVHLAGLKRRDQALVQTAKLIECALGNRASGLLSHSPSPETTATAPVRFFGSGESEPYHMTQARVLSAFASKLGLAFDSTSHKRAQVREHPAHGQLCSTFVSVMKKVNRSHCNQCSVDDVSSFAGSLVALASKHHLTLPVAFYAAWIRALYQPDNRYKAVADTEGPAAFKINIKDEIDYLMTPIISSVVEGISLELRQNSSEITDSIVDLLTRTKTEYGLTKALTVALSAVARNPNQISLDSFARLLKTSNIVYDIERHQEIVSQIDELFVSASHLQTPSVGVGKSVRQKSSKLNIEPRANAIVELAGQQDISAFMQSLTASLETEPKGETVDGGKSKKRALHLSSYTHLNPDTHIGYLLARSQAHRRLFNGPVCLQILNTLRNFASQQACTSHSLERYVIDRRAYEDTIYALYKWKPASPEEHELVSSLHHLPASLLQTMKNDEIFATPRTVQCLLQLFAKSADANYKRKWNIAGQAQRLVWHICTVPTDPVPNCPIEVNSHYLGHERVPLTVEILDELVKIFCLERRSLSSLKLIKEVVRLYANRPIAMYTQADKNMLVEVDIQSVQGSLYDNIIYNRAVVRGQLAFAEDILTKFVLNEGLQPTQYAIDSIVLCYVRHLRNDFSNRSRHFLGARYVEKSSAGDVNAQDDDAVDEEEPPQLSIAHEFDVVDWVQSMFNQTRVRPSPKYLRQLLETNLAAHGPASDNVFQCKRIVRLIEELYSIEERLASASVDNVKMTMKSRQHGNYFVRVDDVPVEAVANTLKADGKKVKGGKNNDIRGKNNDRRYESNVVTVSAYPPLQGLLNRGGVLSGTRVAVEVVDGVHVGALSAESLSDLYKKYNLFTEMSDI